MKVETVTVHCDTYGCPAFIVSSAADARGKGWLLTATQDLCPAHAPAEYSCARCGGEYVTLASFDAHLTDCKKRR